MIRVDTLEELLDTAQLLAAQPVPDGRRVAIVGNAGGPGILAADACVGAGLTVDPLEDATVAALRAAAPEASIGNPIDLGAAATPDMYTQVLPIVLTAAEVDAVLVIYAPPVVTAPVEVAEAVAAAVAQSAGSKAVAACFLARADVTDALRRDGVRAERSRRSRFPRLRRGRLGGPPSSAHGALDRSATFRRWTAWTPTRPVPSWSSGCAIRRTGLGSAGPSARRCLRAVGIDVVESRTVEEAAVAARVAEEMGYPVVLKVEATGVLHKSDVGGVRLDLGSAAEVHAAYESMHRDGR